MKRNFYPMRVERADSGGELYAPVDQHGVESGHTPSYDREAIKRLCDQLNAPRTVSCGCCAGVGAELDHTGLLKDRCVCAFHQDVPRGTPAHVCSHHAVHGHPRVTSPVANDWRAL